MSSFQKALFISILLAFAALIGWKWYKSYHAEKENPSYRTLVQEIKTNPSHIKHVSIDKTSERIEVTTTDPPPKDKISYEGPSEPERPELLSLLERANIDYDFVPRKDDRILSAILGSLFPIILMVIGGFFLFRFIQTGPGRAMSLGGARIKTVNPENTNKVTFADVAGIDESKAEVQELVDFLKDTRKFTRLGGRIPKGVLLTGPPGTGKTLLARAIAGEAGVPFFSSSGSEFDEMLVGLGASRIRDLFEQAKRSAPCIIFIDEIDAVGRQRGNRLRGSPGEEQTLNQLLVEMDGFDPNHGVILIGATNRPDVLDQALLRPGRFDRHVVVPLPDIKGREEILRVHSRRVPLAQDVSLATISRGTPGFSGAELEALINEAALLAARQGGESVTMNDLEEAKTKVIMGPARKSMVISESEKRITAYHEAGHTLVANLLPNTDPVHLVTIIPRGPSLGSTHQLPVEDRFTTTKDWVEARIAVCMGGRVAEELVFHHLTTGASNDLEQATELARKMVCEWGMSEALGPLTYGKRESASELAMGPTYSPDTAQLIDAEIRRIVVKQHERVIELLQSNSETLKRIAEALLERETLHAEDLKKLLAGEALQVRSPPVATA